MRRINFQNRITKREFTFLLFLSYIGFKSFTIKDQDIRNSDKVTTTIIQIESHVLEWSKVRLCRPFPRLLLHTNEKIKPERRHLFSLDLQRTYRKVFILIEFSPSYTSPLSFYSLKKEINK